LKCETIQASNAIYVTDEGALVDMALASSEEGGEEGGEGGGEHWKNKWQYIEQKITVKLSNTVLSTTNDDDNDNDNDNGGGGGGGGGDRLTKNSAVGTITCQIYQAINPLNAALVLDTNASISIPTVDLVLERKHYVLLQSIMISNIGAPPENLMPAEHGGGGGGVIGGGGEIDGGVVGGGGVQYNYGNNDNGDPHRLSFHLDAASLGLTLVFDDEDGGAGGAGGGGGAGGAAGGGGANGVHVLLNQLNFDYNATVEKEVDMLSSIRNIVVRSNHNHHHHHDRNTTMFSAAERTKQESNGLTDMTGPLLTYKSTKVNGNSRHEIYLEPYVLSLHPVMLRELPSFFTLLDEEMDVPAERKEDWLVTMREERGSLEVVLVIAQGAVKIGQVPVGGGWKEEEIESKEEGEEGEEGEEKDLRDLREEKGEQGMECLLSGLVSYIVKNPEQPQVNTLRIDLSRFVCRRNSGARTMVEPTSAELVVHTGRHGEKTYETRLHSTKVHVSFTDLDFLTTLTRNWSNVLYRPDTRHPTTTAVEVGGGKGR
jgi:hypothetical protein